MCAWIMYVSQSISVTGSRAVGEHSFASPRAYRVLTGDEPDDQRSEGGISDEYKGC